MDPSARIVGAAFCTIADVSPWSTLLSASNSKSGKSQDGDHSATGVHFARTQITLHPGHSHEHTSATRTGGSFAARRIVNECRTGRPAHHSLHRPPKVHHSLHRPPYR